MRNALSRSVRTAPTDNIGRKTNPSKNTTKSTRQRRSTEEQSNPVMLLISLIPHGQIEHHAGKQSTLSNPQRCPRSQVASVVLDNTQERGHDTPDQGEGGQPDARGGLFQHDVAGDFEDDVADEVEGEAGEVLVAGLYRQRLVWSE